MPITLEQIKADVAAGKCPFIYFSSVTLWWTHSDLDVQEATVAGKIKADESLERFLSNPHVSEVEKRRLKSLKAKADESSIPLDPTGAPLYMADPKQWIEKAEKEPRHFGEHGLKALMYAHHQNCKKLYAGKWEMYNKAIDLDNAF